MAVTEGQTGNGVQRFVATGDAPRAVRGGDNRPVRNPVGDEAGTPIKDAGDNASSRSAAAGRGEARAGSGWTRGAGNDPGVPPVTDPGVRRNVFHRSVADAAVTARSDAGAGQGAIPRDRLSGS